MSIAVRPFDEDRAAAVARLHGRSLGGLMSCLGESVLREFYAGVVTAPGVVALLAEDRAGLPLGFVLGGPDADALRAHAARRRRWPLLLAVLAGLARRPSAGWWLLHRTLRPRAGGAPAGGAELVYLAVDEGARGAGVGTALVDAFDAVMRGEGVAGYALSVDAENARAIRFYERHGLRRTGAYRQFGRRHLRYRRQL